MDNILVISDFYDIQYHKNSGTPALRLIIEALAKKYSVHIIAPQGKEEDGDNIFYHRVNLCPPMNVFESKLFWAYYSLIAPERAKHLDNKYHFKLVYGAGSTSTHIAANIGRELSIPSVGRLFGTYLAPFLNSPIRLWLRLEECMAFKSECNKFVVTEDGTQGDKVAQHFGIPNDKLCFWRNGVNLPSRFCIKPTQALHVISMARLEKWKRVDRIIWAYYRAVNVYPDLILDIVSTGPEEDNLKKLVKDLKLKQVFFHGQVTRTEASCLLTSADIFISANDYSNLSNSLMEAMVCGKAIVALNTGATADLVKNMDTGLLAENEDGLIDALLQACNPKIRELVGKGAKKYAQEHFETWDQRIEKEVSVIEELIK